VKVKIFAFAIALYFLAPITVAAEMVDESQALAIAERFNLKNNFAQIFACRKVSDGDNKLIVAKLESELLRKMWSIEFEENSLLARIEEERSALEQVITDVEARKTHRAAIIDSVNFLSTGAIALTGSAIFIPAPPPRPTVPNILFTVASGVSTSLSLINLVQLSGGKSKAAPYSTSIAREFYEEKSAIRTTRYGVWYYLDSTADSAAKRPKDIVLAKWPLVETGKKCTVFELRKRLTLLDEIYKAVLGVNHDLALLVRAL
jgi:hypothetical protein